MGSRSLGLPKRRTHNKIKRGRLLQYVRPERTTITKIRNEKALTDSIKVIDMLSTHPEHERRGAGSMLVKWGTDIADSLGMKSFVQGSRRGKPLYERHGFVDKEGWITVPVTERHKDRPECGWFNLERPAKATTIPEAKKAV